MPVQFLPQVRQRCAEQAVEHNSTTVPAGAPAPNYPRLADSRDSCAYVSIRARSGRWLADEVGGGGALEGRLRARSGSIDGPWEMMWLCWNAGTGTYYLAAQRNYHDTLLNVAAEMGSSGSEQGVLRARTDPSMPINTWELFHIGSHDGWTTFRQWEGPYVASEEDWTGSDQFTLRARTTAALGTWEQFAVYIVGRRT
ncbi:hypothetical protein BXY51_008241 [Actinoplanes cyaneus]|nr:hypothetical protein [Actinoplanes cyaneus]